MDGRLLIALKFTRMLAYGLTTVILVPFLHQTGCNDAEVGLFMSLTLVGDVLLSFMITFQADKIGRRFMLGVSSILMLLSGVCFMFSSNFWILLGAAVFGVISPSGDEVGPFRSIEESSIAQVSSGPARAHLFAAQNLVGTLAMAAGFAVGGWLSDTFTEKTGKAIDAYRVVFFGYVMCALASLVLSAQLSNHIEVPGVALPLESPADHPQASPESGSQDNEGESEGSSNHSDLVPSEDSTAVATSMWLITLFGLDSLAYGFMTNSWLAEYIYRRFSSSTTYVGLLFFFASAISALTSFPSAWLTNKIGALESISLTKLGAGFFGGLIPLAPRIWGAMAMIWARSLFDTMDVVPRQIFLTSIVGEADRTRVFGLVNISKTVGRAVGPLCTGLFAQHNRLGWCFAILGSLEWVFAATVYYVFR